MKNYEPLTAGRKAEAVGAAIETGMCDIAATCLVDSMEDYAKKNDVTFYEAAIAIGQINDLREMPIENMHKTA